ncbi:MAG TPA: hemerythrin domain-containing protein [Candidatus Baltobacteraceae bacterium]|nr:hemerythrin domain-containing protein [Candidatus Baltobacteraceae bacterium]
MKALIQELRGEHEVILNRLDQLERALQSGDSAQVADFMDFVQTYIEERHHAKEEQVLFPRMREDPFLAGIADALIEEHDDARRMAERMRCGDPAELLKLYAENLRWHIAKEDAMIFESAEHSLTR